MVVRSDAMDTANEVHTTICHYRHVRGNTVQLLKLSVQRFMTAT